MVSPIQQLHAQRVAAGGRRPVVVYSPGRRVAAPAPSPRRPAAPPPTGTVNWAEVEEAFASTKGAKQKAQKQLQQQAEDAAWDNTPWYKKGLGVVLGNPVVSNFLKPLGVLGVPGKAVTLGFEEIVEGLGLTDDELTANDKRSNWEKLAPTSDYGVGQLLDPDNPIWLNRIAGFLGDVAFDPTTYLTGGATRIAGAAVRGAKVGKAASAVGKVDQYLDDITRAAEAGNFEEVGRLSQLGAEQGAMARRLEAEAGAIPMGKRVPLRQGRKARASFIGELTEENPELVARYKDELASAAEKGFNTIRDPALREAIGLGDPALRWMGMNIPKTEKLIYPFARAGGGARALSNKAPLLGSTMARFAPKGLEEPLNVLTRGRGGDVLRSGTAVRIQNLMRRAAGSMEGRGNKALTDLVRSPEWKAASADQIRALVRQAELDDAPNSINKFFGKLTEIYETVAGRPIDVTRDPNTYVPHMMTPQFKRYLRAKADKGGKEYEELGFVVDDLLEGSKYLEKSRKLTPDVPGQPKDFEVAGKTFTLTDGSIDELNEELGRVFSDFKGKAYMDDPRKIGEAYISSISRQAGRDFALDRLAESGNPLVVEIAGEIAAALDARNAWARQNPVTELIKAGYIKGQRLVPAKARGDMPTSEYDELFGVTKHVAETQAQRDLLMKEGKQYVEAVGADVSARRTTIVDNLRGLKSKLMSGLQTRASKATSEIKRLNTVLEKTSDEIKKLGPLTTENTDDFVGLHVALDNKVREIKGDIKKIQDRYGKKLTREQAAIDRELRKTLAELDRQTKAIQGQYDKAATTMKREALARKELLERDVRAAEERLTAAEAKLRPRAVSSERVHEANAFIRTDFETEDAFEAQRATYVEALRQMRAEGAPIARRIDGRLTPETVEQVRKVAATIEPQVPPAAAVEETVAPPPAAVVPEPPAAVVPTAAPLDLSLRKQPDGSWATADGFTIRKAGKQYQVELEGDDFGLWPNLQAAKDEVELQQRLLADEDVIPTTVNPQAAPPPPEPKAPAPLDAGASTEEVAPTLKPKRAPTRRLTRKTWKYKNAFGRRIEVDVPTGWQIEPFQGSTRMQTEGGKLVPAGAARGKRWVAIHPDKTQDVLRGRSFASAREAKLAVEDVIRRQRRKTTLADIAARSNMAEPKVWGVSEQVSNLRPAMPTTVTPEQAAANRAAAEAVQQKPRPQPRPRGETYEAEVTPELEAVIAAGEGMGPRTVIGPQDPRHAYRQDYAEWNRQLAMAEDASLPKAERDAARRKARSLGGEFTQTTGKHHKRHSAENVMIEDALWEADRQADPAWAKANKDYNDAIAATETQVEAMVYVKHHNPITGDDVYTRAPDTSIGFGEGEERIPVPVEVPTQGAVPQGTMREPEWIPPESPYTPEQRAADRAFLDDPQINVIMPDHQKKYGQLVERSEKIAKRITDAEANQARLDELDQAARAAYTEQVRQADELVAQAKRAEAKAEGDWRSETLIPNAHANYEAAKRVTRETIDQQTAVRQAWMQADQAYRDALAERQAYEALEQNAVKAEQALYHKGSNGDANVKAIKGDNPEGWDGVHTRPLPLISDGKGGLVPQHADVQKTANALRKALTDLEAARAAGKGFMTDIERRRLVGTMVGIDDAKRELAQTVNSDIRRAQAVLPRARFEDVNITNPEASPIVRSSGRQTPTSIPPVQGQEGLPGRAYAESFEATMPSTRQAWQLDEEGTPQLVTQVHGRQEYVPRTEREAIADLEKQAETTIAGTPAGKELLRQERNIAEQAKAAPGLADIDKQAAALASATAKNEALLPLRDQVETLTKVHQAVNDKEKLIPLRAAAQADRQVLIGAKVSKKADLVRVADDIEAVAKQNPDLLDQDMAVTEAVLQSAREEAKILADNDLSRSQVQTQIDKVGSRKDKSLDVMLTTVGKNWRMLYEATGGKTAVLQHGDLIVDAELHKMYRNIYDISKDKVLFGRTLNAFTNLFKTYATLTPGFHVRNALSAIFMNSADGVPMKTQLRAAQIWREYMNAPDGEAWIAKQSQQIRDAFDATHGTGAGGRFTEAGFAEVAESGGWLDFMERAQRNRFTRLSQRAGQRVEGSVRLAMALHSMDLGENVESAIQRINRIHFDYGEISKMDENMKRLIPFWTFMSRNMPMQVSQMWTKPRIYQQYEDFVRNMSSTNEEYTPEYWTKAGAFNTGLNIPEGLPTGGAQGLPIYLSPDLGFTRLEADLKDYEDFLSGKRPGGVLSQFNPLLSAPIEFATRQDIFTGQRFDEGETVPAGGILGLPIKLSAMLTGQYEGGEVDAAWANTVRALNPLQDRSSRLLPQLSGGDEEGRKRQLESWLRTMLGAPVRTLTPKQQDNEYYRRLYDEMDALKREQERALRQAG